MKCNHNCRYYRHYVYTYMYKCVDTVKFSKTLPKDLTSNNGVALTEMFVICVMEIKYASLANACSSVQRAG